MKSAPPASNTQLAKHYQEAIEPIVEYAENGGEL
jgi:hypothetical protein